MQDISTTAVPKRSLTQAWAVCTTAALYFFYIFIQMMKFNSIGQPLMADFNMTSAGLGVLSSMYFWGNVIFLFIAGLILDRCSTKKTLAIVMIVAIVSTFGFAFTNSVASASWCFLALGIAGAFALMIPLRLAERWFPSEKMALASGVIITIGFTGAMVSQAPLAKLVELVGWRHAMMWDAGAGVLLFILSMLVIKDYPAGVTPSTRPDSTISALLASLKKAVSNRQNWLFGLYTSLVNLPMFVFGAFGVACLQQMYGVTLVQASLATTVMFLGGMLGSPAFGAWSDRAKNRKMPMYVGGFISLALMFVVMYGDGLFGATALVAIFFAIGFFTSSQVITYPVIAESNTDDVIGAGFGMGSTLIMAGGAVLVPIFGWLLGAGSIVDGIQTHSTADYRFAMWLLPISIIISIIAITFGKETNCKKIV